MINFLKKLFKKNVCKKNVYCIRFYRKDCSDSLNSIIVEWTKEDTIAYYFPNSFKCKTEFDMIKNECELTCKVVKNVDYEILGVKNEYI